MHPSRRASAMKIAIGCAVITALLGSPVFAADMVVKAPPPPPAPGGYSWTGCYLGANLGWSHEKTTGLNSIPATTIGGAPFTGVAYPGTTEKGALGGAQIGCNYQFQNRWVVGIEGDWDAINHQGQAFTTAPGLNPADVGGTQELWESTLRGRLGFAASDKTLLYVTGGAAWMRVASFQFVNGFQPTTWNEQTDTQLGWTVGAGLEYAVTNNVVLRAEYLYVNIPGYNTFTGATVAGPPAPLRTSLTENIIRGGISFKSGWLPIVAP